ncbi:related to inosine-uridine preferring nucleoside hydrolase [Ramularia collo-cygni]|uniref:Related to inosine-uridine preferring nucleoside hydrolase n=1 Tax=Ramularia collo-cygni TaxID=112498 RepID=A0A2D3VAZ3_9PEZI|nr:related to inosine-uridine preferring nucleoside hydrolase [Ramularia collo-cygni]CZT25243.1 related to inosine-uridine preferring nucleoside hydrolase [Ramularia collo-cygni]
MLSSLLLALSATIVSAVPASTHQDGNVNGTIPRPKVIFDNDWNSVGFVPFLQALKANWDVLGLVSDTSDSWALQCGLHALAILEVGDLECIPVYRGANYPLLNTPGLYRAWADVHGRLPWEGAFAPENQTKEALGNNPTSGDPNRISKSAFKEGYPNNTFASDISAAEFMVQQVRKYPGEVTIYSAGALTNIALAARIDPNFAKNTKGLVIMGGYLDGNLLQTTGSTRLADFQSDINLKMDPESSKIVLTSPFPKITINGNVANTLISTQEFLDEIYEVKNPYSELMHKHYGTEFPFWDETAAAVMVDPSIVKNSTQFYLDVDTSYGSPTYGNIHAYQKELAPRVQTLQLVDYILEIDVDAFKKQIKEAVQYPPTCGSF